MSIVTDRRCDGCGTIREWGDESWLALIPPGWDGSDRRLDFCDETCLQKAARRKNFRDLVEWNTGSQDSKGNA